MMLSREAITAAVEAHLESGRLLQAGARRDLRGRARAAQRAASRSTRSRSPRSCAGRGSSTQLGGRPDAAAHPGGDARVGERGALRADRLGARRCSGASSRPRASIQEMAFTSEDDVDETLDRAESAIFEVAERRVADTMRQLHPGARARRSTSSKRCTTATATIVGTATGYHDLDEHPARAAAVDADDRRGASRPGQDVVRARHRAARRAARRASRCCSSRWRWVTSSSPSGCSRPRHGSPRASCQTGKLSEHEWPQRATRRSADSPKHRSSSTTTRTAR